MITSKETLFAVAIIFIAAIGIVTIFFNPSEISEAPSSPPEARCGIESCHGLDISCGSEVPDFCTMQYELGDGCRKFVSCEVTEGQCQQRSNPEFDSCKTCVETCLTKQAEDETFDVWACENSCLDRQ